MEVLTYSANRVRHGTLGFNMFNIVLYFALRNGKCTLSCKVYDACWFKKWKLYTVDSKL